MSGLATDHHYIFNYLCHCISLVPLRRASFSFLYVVAMSHALVSPPHFSIILSNSTNSSTSASTSCGAICSLRGSPDSRWLQRYNRLGNGVCSSYTLHGLRTKCRFVLGMNRVLPQNSMSPLSGIAITTDFSYQLMCTCTRHPPGEQHLFING